MTQTISVEKKNASDSSRVGQRWTACFDLVSSIVLLPLLSIEYLYNYLAVICPRLGAHLFNQLAVFLFYFNQRPMTNESEMTVCRYLIYYWIYTTEKKRITIKRKIEKLRPIELGPAGQLPPSFRPLFLLFSYTSIWLGEIYTFTT